MADIKFSEFPKANQSKDSDEIAILQDGVNKMIASPVLESKIINKTVSRVIEQGGASLNVINLKGVVPTYADLALITPTPELNDAYQVEADGLVYVYTENGFQADGDGFVVQPEPTGVVEEGNPNAVSGGEVFNYAVSKDSSKILPENYNYLNFDRPDLEMYDLVLVDKNNNIIKKIIFNDDTESDTENELVELSIDRPDLKFALVDKNNNIIQIEEIEKAEFGFKELNFFKTNTDYGGFNANTDIFMRNYNDLISIYDGIASDINNEFHTTVEKEILCNSGVSGAPIYFYRIKNDNAKIKILLNTGTHANEKMYIYGLLKIFEEITLTPFNDPNIQWLRDNCEIVVIPCLNISSIGWDEKLLGSRTVAETKPFKATYSSDGTKTTITFNPIDFPTENELLESESYFKSNNGRKKRAITINATDDNVNMPRGLYVYEVVNGTTITIDSVNSNIVNGEIYIHHWSDPMRNVGVNLGIYDNFTTSGNILQLDDSTNYSRYDGIGSKPNSLQEISAFIDFVNTEDFDLVTDCHCPPRNNYVSTNKNIKIQNSFTFMSEIKRFMAIFNKDEFTTEDNILYNKGSLVNVYPSWYTGVGNRCGFVIEWGSGLTTATGAQVNEAINFLYAVIVTTIRNSVRNNK